MNAFFLFFFVLYFLLFCTFGYIYKSLGNGGVESLTNNKRLLKWFDISFISVICVFFAALVRLGFLAYGEDWIFDFPLLEVHCAFGLFLLMGLGWDWHFSSQNKTYKGFFKSLSWIDLVLLLLVLFSASYSVILSVFESPAWMVYSWLSLWGVYTLFLKYIKNIVRKNMSFSGKKPSQKWLSRLFNIPLWVVYLMGWFFLFESIVIIPFMYIDSQKRDFYHYGEMFLYCKEDCIVSQESCLKKGYIWHEEEKLCELSPVVAK